MMDVGFFETSLNWFNLNKIVFRDVLATQMDSSNIGCEYSMYFDSTDIELIE